MKNAWTPRPPQIPASVWHFLVPLVPAFGTTRLQRHRLIQKTQNTKKISRQTRVHFNAIYEMFAMIFLNACPSLNDSRNGSEILQQSSCLQNRYCIHIRMGARRQWWAISSDVGAQSIANPTKSLHTFIHWANSTSYPYVTANLWRPLIKLHHHKQWT